MQASSTLQPKTLRRVVFGNPLLRQPAATIPAAEIKGAAVTQLIADMRHTLQHKKYGVALAAPQVGRRLALVVVGIKPTPTRPNRKPQEGVFINPVITKYHGVTKPQWEGCISLGSPTDPIFAQARRYPKIDIQYLDVQGRSQQRTVDGFLAHVLQHEVDHLNGVLFVDHVKDSKTFMNASEYRKRVALRYNTD